MSIIKIDDHEFDTALLPPGNIEKLLLSAIGHKVRNEAASKARAQLVSRAKEAAGDAWQDGDEKAIAFDREDERHLALYREAQREISETIRSGEIGSGRASGPRLSEAEKLTDLYCRDQVLSMIQAPKFRLWWDEKNKPIKNKMPPRDHVFRFADGREREFGEMISSYYAANKANVDRHVAKVLSDKAKAAEKAAAAAEEGLPF